MFPTQLCQDGFYLPDAEQLDALCNDRKITRSKLIQPTETFGRINAEEPLETRPTLRFVQWQEFDAERKPSCGRRIKLVCHIRRAGERQGMALHPREHLVHL